MTVARCGRVEMLACLIKSKGRGEGQQEAWKTGCLYTQEVAFAEDFRVFWMLLGPGFKETERERRGWE